MIFRIFTNDRGTFNGTPKYSALMDVEAESEKAAVGKVSSNFGPPRFAPIKALEWPAASMESKRWLATYT